MFDFAQTTDLQRAVARFGAASAGWEVVDGQFVVSIPVPLIGDTASEEPISARAAAGNATISACGRVARLTLGDQEVAIAVAPIADGLEPVTHAVYQQLFSAFDNCNTYRFWNYVPNINRKVEGQEDYWRFNAGRHSAYRAHFGDQYEEVMPAASAVGCEGDQLIVIAIGGPSKVSHFENPRQVPAYRYPTKYGPKPPAFARGTVVWQDEKGSAVAETILSGTSSIVGHETVGHGSIADQISVTIENMRIVIDQMRAASNLPADAPLPDKAEFKIYLRNPQDAPQALDALVNNFGIAPDRVLVLQSAICRPDLDVEMEGRW